MISTSDTKQQQLALGFFQSGMGPVKMLIVGSCRVNPYINYLVRFNEGANRFTIRTIDPFDWHWNAVGEMVDYEKAIEAQEKNDLLLAALRETTIFIHEHFANYGMFNTEPLAPKNIYQFCLLPKLDICIPNFHDVAIIGESKEVGLASIEKFCAICEQTSFPEMAEHFRTNWRLRRFFWAANHVSKHFTLFIFKQMNDRFLHLNLTDDFWREAEKEDIYSATPAPVSEQDRIQWQLKW